MATVEVINYCNNNLLKGWKKFNPKTNKNEPSRVDLAFFGINRKVQEAELERMSETEKERHIQQDILLLDVYGCYKSDTSRVLRKKIIKEARRRNLSAKRSTHRFDASGFGSRINIFIKNNGKSIHITIN